MEFDDTVIAIAIIYFAMFWAGLGFAAYIRYHPWRRTWVEVVVGTGGTLAGVVGVNYLLFTLDPIPEMWIILNPFICFFITGITQIIHQELKVRSEDKKAKKEMANRNGEIDD